MKKAIETSPILRNGEFKQIAPAGATTAVATEEVWGEYFGEQSKLEYNIDGGGK